MIKRVTDKVFVSFASKVKGGKTQKKLQHRLKNFKFEDFTQGN